jgi:hypothetical protein
MSNKSQVLEAYSLMKLLRHDLSDSMQMEVEEWLEELREEIKTCKAEGVEPNWDEFGNWINQICDDDGMPRLYVAEEDLPC